MGAFTPVEAKEMARDVLERRRDQLLDQLDVEVEAAKSRAYAYADHLADGGDPWVTPGWSSSPFSRTDREILGPSLGLLAVLRIWNQARGSTNPLIPFENPQKWQAAEKFYERLGEPVLFAEAAGAGVFRLSAVAVMDLLKKIAKEDETVVPRRTKVGGKVAYYLRLRREGDPEEVPYDIPEEAPE
jgi:hypothetical protein